MPRTPTPDGAGPHRAQGGKESGSPSFSESPPRQGLRKEAGVDRPVGGSPSYLGHVGIADLRHDVADVLKDKEPRVQAPEVELVLRVVVYDLPAPDHVLQANEHWGQMSWPVSPQYTKEWQLQQQ